MKRNPITLDQLKKADSTPRNGKPYNLDIMMNNRTGQLKFGKNGKFVSVGKLSEDSSVVYFSNESKINFNTWTKIDQI